MNVTERKKKIIAICLDTFMHNGLINTSMRELGKSLELDPTALYNYFDSKDEVVIACAEEATIRIERELFFAAIADIDNPESLIKTLEQRAVTMRPLMRFFINVCTSQKYCDMLKGVRYRQGDRYRFYISKIAEKLGCSYDDAAPLVYIVANTMFSYMIFDPDNFSAPQLTIVHNKLKEFLRKRDNK